MNWKTYLISATFLGLPLMAQADGHENNVSVTLDDRGLHFGSDQVNATLNAQVQAGYRYLGFDNGDSRGLDDTSGVEVYSARLELAGDAVEGRLGYKLEYDFQSGVQGDGSAGGNLLDGWIEYRFEDTGLRVGNQKVPLSRQQLAEVNQLHFPLRSLATEFFALNSNLFGRDEGILFHGDYGNARFQIGAFNGESTGEGDNFDAVDTKVTGAAMVSIDFGDFGSRIEEGDMRDGDREMAGTMGLSVQYGQAEIADAMGFEDDFERLVLNADAGVRNNGMELSAEFFYETSEFDGQDSRDDIGLHAQIGQMFGDYEAAFRFAFVEPDEDFSSVDDLQEYTLGVSKFFNGHNSKIQAAVSLINIGRTVGDEDDTDVEVNIVATQRL